MTTWWGGGDVPPPLSCADADAVVAAVLTAGPGPWAASALLTVSAADVSDPVRFDLQRAWQAQQGWTDAQAALALADDLGPPPRLRCWPGRSAGTRPWSCPRR